MFKNCQKNDKNIGFRYSVWNCNKKCIQILYKHALYFVKYVLKVNNLVKTKPSFAWQNYNGKVCNTWSDKNRAERPPVYK